MVTDDERPHRHPDPPKIRAGITIRIHEGELVMAISDGEGNITLHRIEEPEAPDPEGTQTGEAD